MHSSIRALGISEHVMFKMKVSSNRVRLFDQRPPMCPPSGWQMNPKERSSFSNPGLVWKRLGVSGKNTSVDFLSGRIDEQLLPYLRCRLVVKPHIEGDVRLVVGHTSSVERGSRWHGTHVVNKKLLSYGIQQKEHNWCWLLLPDLRYVVGYTRLVGHTSSVERGLYCPTYIEVNGKCNFCLFIIFSLWGPSSFGTDVAALILLRSIL
jgi:hypothetical protein